MRLLDRLAAPQSRAALPVNDFASFMAQTWTGSKDVESVQATFASYAADGYGGNGVVYACILARLQLFAQAEFKFQNLADKRLFGSPALLPLERPWPGGTTAELLARMEQDVSLAGNAFVRRWPDRLERLRPDYIDIVRGDAYEGGPDGVIGYIYWHDGRGGGEDEFIPVEDVAHWSPIPDPLSEARGMSWLTPVVREINADMAMTEHKAQFLANAATPNMVLRYSQKLGKETVDALRERWQARYGGPANGWKTAVLDEGADLTVVGSNFEQMAFTGVQSAGEGRIAIASGVPPIVAGLAAGLQAATYSNYEQALKAFANGTMAFLWQSAAAALAKLVEVPGGARLWYDVTAIPALREAETLRAEAAFTWSKAAGELIRAGYEPQTVQNALTAGDMALLKHTGAVPTALYPDGVAPSPARSEALEWALARPVEQPSVNVTISDGAVRAVVEPTPVTIGNTVNVEPTPLEVRNEVTVEPTPVTVENAVTVERADLPPQPAPIVNVTVDPTPVTIDNTVNVDPTPVTVEVPPRTTTTTVERDPRSGLITKTTATEK